MAYQNKNLYKTQLLKNIIALVDSGANINCIQEGLIPLEYFEKTLQRVVGAKQTSSWCRIQGFKCSCL